MTRHGRISAYLIGVLPVLLLSFVLRVYQLDGQSLWYDEGNSAVMATRSLQQILVNSAADIHPPLYYLLLHWWSGLTGTTEFALRYLSVVFGMLAVASLVAIGGRLAGSAEAVVAGILAATSPFLVYYSQEARMYAQLCALSTLSMYAFFRLLSSSSNTPAAGIVGPAFHTVEKGAARSGDLSALRLVTVTGAYVLTTAAALYTQYFAFSLLLTQGIILLALLLRRHPWRPLARLLGAQLAVAVLYLPWLTPLWHQFGTWSTSAEPTPFIELLHDVFLVFSFGLSWDATATDKSQLLIGALLIVAAAGQFIRPRGRARDALQRIPAMLLFLAVPLLVVVGLELRRPTYQPKLIIGATMAFDLLLAVGIVSLGGLAAALATWLHVQTAASPRMQPVLSRLYSGSRGPMRPIGVAAVVGLVVILVTFFDSRSLIAYYDDPKYARDDYRALAQFIQTREEKGDAIVLNAPNQIEILDYYYRGVLARYPLPAQRPLDEAATGDDLARLVASHARLWLVEWAVRESDPQGFIDNWLGQRYRGTQVGQFGQVKLLLYQVAGSGPS